MASFRVVVLVSQHAQHQDPGASFVTVVNYTRFPAMTSIKMSASVSSTAFGSLSLAAFSRLNLEQNLIKLNKLSD